MPHVQGTRRIVLEQLEHLLMADPGLQIIGQGSWLRPLGEATKKGPISRNYFDPLLGGTSDHDLRLVLQGKDQALVQRWKLAQDRLREGIRAVFPKGASASAIEETLLRYGFQPGQAKALAAQGSEALVHKILQSVNLYAPPQLMRDVVNDKTARALFKNLGTVPNLAGQMVEGVWGEGATTAIQEFESAGRLFYNSGKGVRGGFVDLVHLAEGQGRYTLGGAANLSSQWAEKALEALQEGDPELVAKYLKRLKANLQLAVKKGNLPPGALGDTLSHLDQLIEGAGKGAINPIQARQALKRAGMQASILKEMARNPGAQDREIMQAILDGQRPGRYSEVGKWFRQTWESVDNAVLFERTLQGVFLAFSVWQTAGTWGEYGMETALRQAGVEAAMLASLPVGAVALLANHMLETAKQAGYDMAVRPQDWADFLAGISSVKGFQGFSRKELSIQQLAVQAVTPEEVRKVVESQATHISQLRDTGTAESEAGAEKRSGVWQALVNRMTPIVTSEWLQARKRMLMEYIDLALELDALMDETVLRAVIQPQPVQVEADGDPSARVSLQLDSSVPMARFMDLLKRMEERIKPLGGPRKLIYFSYRGEVSWTCNGEKRTLTAYTRLEDLFQPVECSLPGRGSHPVVADFRLKVDVDVKSVENEAPDVLAATPLLLRDYQRRIPASVDVLSLARARVEPVPQARLAMPREITAGEVVKLHWDRSQLPAFKPGNYRVVLLPRGTRLSQQDFYMLAFDPSGKPGGVFKYPLDVVSETLNGDQIDIEVMIPQIDDIQAPEELDLAFIFMDHEASLDTQLEQAMAELAQAEADMEAFERELEAMPEAEREKILQQMEQMEEAMAAALAKAETEPETFDPADMALPAESVRSLPVTVQPLEIAFQTAPGWHTQQADSPAWRQAEIEEGQPQAGENIYAQGKFSVHVSYDDPIWGSSARDAFDADRKRPDKPVIAPMTMGTFTGEILRWPEKISREITPFAEDPGNETAQEIQRCELGAMGLLTQGRIQVRIDYSALSVGYLRRDRDSEGNIDTLYDNREEAAQRCTDLAHDLEAMLATLQVGRQRANAPPASSPAPLQEAREGTHVRLVAAKGEAEPGELVEVRALLQNPKGDEGSLSYEWIGNHAGQGDSVLFLASDPGKYELSVIVRGAGGFVDSASVSIRVR